METVRSNNIFDLLSLKKNAACFRNLKLSGSFRWICLILSGQFYDLKMIKPEKNNYLKIQSLKFQELRITPSTRFKGFLYMISSTAQKN